MTSESAGLHFSVDLIVDDAARCFNLRSLDCHCYVPDLDNKAICLFPVVNVEPSHIMSSNYISFFIKANSIIKATITAVSVPQPLVYDPLNDIIKQGLRHLHIYPLPLPYTSVPIRVG